MQNTVMNAPSCDTYVYRPSVLGAPWEFSLPQIRPDAVQRHPPPAPIV
jgi:hypothetical protein